MHFKKVAYLLLFGLGAVSLCKHGDNNDEKGVVAGVTENMVPASTALAIPEVSVALEMEEGSNFLRRTTENHKKKTKTAGKKEKTKTTGKKEKEKTKTTGKKDPACKGRTPGAGMVRSGTTKVDVKTRARHGKTVLTYHASAGKMLVYWVTGDTSPLAPKVLIANEYEFVTKTEPNTIHTLEYDDVTEKGSTTAAHNAMEAVCKTSGDHHFAHNDVGWAELTKGNKLLTLAEKAVGKAATGATVKGMSSDSLHQHNLIITF
ncbi:hypothetical protein G7Y89_g11152 [Cudoniella acicularis]|uniref:Lipoprotein n=1 Tax=Cudoniella acicularis TaxID=354080 RepID=A0A8H4RDN7_9HELO|nr:hypothetical protein G7Y89_g11152 [Cudoniella acicularis]